METGRGDLTYPTLLLVYLILPKVNCHGTMNQNVKTLEVNHFSKTLGVRMLKLKMDGMKILTFRFKQYMMTQLSLT